VTYLDLVNNVLRRIRETEVSSVQSTSYSKLIGDLINDAKDLVETSWDWSALRTTLTITTTADVFNYSLTGSQNNIKELNVLNDTSNLPMIYQTNNWFDSQFLLGNPVSGSPVYYTYNGVDTDGDTLIDVYPKPDGVYSLRFNCVLRNGDLSADTDTIKIPAMPVVHLAVAFATRERGETGGTSSTEYFSMANKYLSDAIAMDAARHPEETIFYTP
tara:strand:+ start:215 stop:862 length:648 start_codon:yes stop_codon:yes gene_type:complete